MNCWLGGLLLRTKLGRVDVGRVFLRVSHQFAVELLKLVKTHVAVLDNVCSLCIAGTILNRFQWLPQGHFICRKFGHGFCTRLLQLLLSNPRLVLRLFQLQLHLIVGFLEALLQPFMLDLLGDAVYLAAMQFTGPTCR